MSPCDLQLLENFFVCSFCVHETDFTHCKQCNSAELVGALNGFIDLFSCFVNRAETFRLSVTCSNRSILVLICRFKLLSKSVLLCLHLGF